MIPKVDHQFKIEIQDNKINCKAIKELKDKWSFVLEELSIDKMMLMINERFDKIKLVKNAKYQNLIIYEYKIVLEWHLSLRIGFAIDKENQVILILAIVILTSGLRKNYFDSLLAKQFKG